MKGLLGFFLLLGSAGTAPLGFARGGQEEKEQAAAAVTQKQMADAVWKGMAYLKFFPGLTAHGDYQNADGAWGNPKDTQKYKAVRDACRVILFLKKGHAADRHGGWVQEGGGGFNLDLTFACPRR